MDPRTEVPREAKDESSDDESRISPITPSLDDDIDSDKSTSNSKKRKRGSYRCSRCGMPKRGHNCPDTYEGVHFAIVESPSPANSSQLPKSGPSSQTATPPFELKHSFDDCNRETLLMHLNALHEENMRLRHENMQLHEVCQFQVHALHSMHSHPNPDFVHGANGVSVNGVPANGVPVVMRSGGHGMFQSGPPALPAFAPAFQGPDLPHHFNTAPQAPPSLPSAPPASTVPKTAEAPLGIQHALPTFLPAPPMESPSDDRAPPPKRAKHEETFFNASSSGHPYVPISAPFPPDHMAEAQRLMQFPAVTVGMDHSSPYEFEYDRHEWFDNDSSTSDYSPSLESSPTLIY